MQRVSPGFTRVRQLLAGILLGLSLIVSSVGCAGSAVVRSTQDFPAGRGFVEHEVTGEGQSHTVWVFVPKDYKPSAKSPAILFLHGLFEAGNGGNKCVSAGLGPVIASHPEKWPFITIF